MKQIKTILKILSSAPNELRKKRVTIVACVVVRSLLDLLGLASVLSVVYFLVRREYWDYAPWIVGVCAIVLVIKMLITHYMAKFCLKWYMALYKFYSEEVLNNYFDAGLLFIRNKGVTNLVYNTNGLCFSFATSVVPAIYQSLGNAIVSGHFNPYCRHRL